MKNDIREFFNSYDIEITNLNIFQEAVTHNSFRNESHINRSYENLEFLGDAVLQLKSSLYLFGKLKQETNNQGELTKARKMMVCETTLSNVSEKIGLGNLIRLGNGEENTGGRHKKSSLADVFEAVTAAIYLDSGE